MKVLKKDERSTIFEHDGNYYYADTAYVPYYGMETMIFHCNPIEGDPDHYEVPNWLDLYCDRSGKSQEECIKEFCDDFADSVIVPNAPIDLDPDDDGIDNFLRESINADYPDSNPEDFYTEEPWDEDFN